MYNKPRRRSSKSDPSQPSPPSKAFAREVSFFEQQTKIKRRRVAFFRFKSVLSIFVILLEILLTLRFFLRLAGANPDNAVAKLIYGLSKPFVSPFLTLFVSSEESTKAVLGQRMFDGHLIVAMTIYGLLGFLLVWLATYIYEQVYSDDA